MKKIIILPFIILFFISFNSCKKGEAPNLPPENTLIISDLNSDSSSSKGINNWLYASSNVAIWSSFIKVGLVVPVTAYKEGLKQKPRYVGDNKWLWQYSVQTLLSKYTVKLYGQINEGNSISWEMYISKENSYQDFLWLKGLQNSDATEGYWILFKSPAENHELLRIDWTADYSDSTFTVRYTNIEPESDENGGYIFYGNNQQGEYNAFYDIYNKGIDNLTEIDYNTKFHNGRVKDYLYFSDSLWHCWDTNFINCDCN